MKVKIKNREYELVASNGVITTRAGDFFGEYSIVAKKGGRLFVIFPIERRHMKNKKGETKGKIKKLYTDKIILTPEKQKVIRKNFQELENSIRLLKKEIKEMPEIDYEKVYQYDSYTYLLLHKAFEEEGMKLKKGDKVIPTKWAIQNRICKEKDKGIVVGFGRNLSSIRIKKNNFKTNSSYWSGFWRLNDKK